MRKLCTGIAVITLALFVLGCESDSDDSPSGTTTIEGTIDTFTVTGTASQYNSLPVERENILSLLAKALGDMLVPNVYADAQYRQGVRIHVDGTGLSTETDQNGYFVLAGVPEGEQTLYCEYAGERAELGLYCPSNSTIRLNNVLCEGGGYQQVNLSEDFKLNGGVCSVDGIQARQGGAGYGGRFRRQ